MEATNQELKDLNAALWRVTEQFHRGFSRVIDPARYGILNAVAAHGEIRPTEIAEELDLVPSSVSRHLQALVEAEFVTVSGNPGDRRSSLVAITDQGRAALDQFDQGGVEASKAVLSDWSRSDIVTLTTALTRLTEAWGKQGDSARRPGRLGRDNSKGFWK